MQRTRSLFPFRSLYDRVSRSGDLKKIAANVGWLTFEHIFRLGVGFLIMIFTARHLGAHDFGILSYAISLVAFLGAFVYLGLSGIVVRDLAENPDSAGTILGSAFALKSIGALVGLGALAILSFAMDSSKDETHVLLLVGASLLVKPSDTIDIWFQSQTASKYTVLARGSAFLLASAGRLALLLMGAPVRAFAALFLVEFILAALFLLLVYVYSGESVRTWSIRVSSMVALIKSSWILLLSSFLALVYLKMDQVMLRWLSGATEVGIYSVAAKISEVWYFIPSAVGISLLPKLTQMRAKDEQHYQNKLQQGFDLLFIMSFSIAILMTFISQPLITHLFGSEYDGAGSVLAIHIWAGVFIFMRGLFSKWIIVENLLAFSLLSHGVGALVNIALNFLLIQRYGGQGAAVATLLSYAVASYFILFFHSKTRPIAFMMTRSILYPVRFVTNWGGRV